MSKTMTEMTPFQKLVASRRSVRHYLSKPVEREKILTCLEAARLAPSADNSQPWRFLILDDPAVIGRFAKEAFSGIYFISRFAAQAPVLILLLARLDLIANRIGNQVRDLKFYLIDVGIAGEHLVLQAEELGLGTCWIGWFNEGKTRRFLKIPKRYKIVSLIAIGYPEKKPTGKKKRKPLEKIAWFNRLGETDTGEVRIEDKGFEPPPV